MKHHITILAESTDSITPSVLADLVHSLSLGLKLHITEVRHIFIAAEFESTFRGPRKPRTSAHITTPAPLHPE